MAAEISEDEIRKEINGFMDTYFSKQKLPSNFGSLVKSCQDDR